MYVARFAFSRVLPVGIPIQPLYPYEGWNNNRSSGKGKLYVTY